MLVRTSRLGHMSCSLGGEVMQASYALTGECAVSILGGDWILCEVVGQHGKGRMGSCVQ